MNTFKIKKKLTKAIEYIEMLEVLKSRNESHLRDIPKFEINGFGNLREHYINRVEVNSKMISRIENRVKELINQSK